MHGLTLKAFRGEQAREYVRPLAQLRMEVFREYPYLYEGNYEYELKYLERYFRSPRSFMLMAFDGTEIVGATSALPLDDEDEDFQAQYKILGYRPSEIFYLGESVLLKDYRGQGLGREFMKQREKEAWRHKTFRYCSFCSVDRNSDDPRKPEGYRTLDHFWTTQGYKRIPEGLTYISWKEIGEEKETPKAMQIWIKELNEKSYPYEGL